MSHHRGPSARPADKGRVQAAAVLAAGMAHHNAGRLAEAEAAYRQILAADPKQPDALHLLGVIALQVGKADIAVELIGQAIRHHDRNAAYFSNLGTALRRLGRFDEALDVCRRAVDIAPGFVDAYNNLANSAMDKQLYDEAAEALRRLLAQRPALVDQRLLLGRALILAGRPAEAADELRDLLERQPGLSAACVNLGVALRKLGRPAEAVAVYRKGLAATPDDTALLSNLGSTLDGEGRGSEAVALFHRAIARQPDFADAHVNLSVALRDLNRLEEAGAAAREAIRLKPDSAEAHTNLGHTRLLLGDLEQGFAEYEWRFRLPDFSSPKRSFGVPVWDGGPLAGRTLLVHDEQGVGDGINFIRYVPLLKERGARVVVEVNTQLVRLFQGVEGADAVVGRFTPLPPVDASVSLLSVPRLLGTRVDTIPAKVPYLKAEPALLESWGERLASVPGRKVGIVWAGSPEHRNDRNRSLALESLAPLGQVPGVCLVSVQKGPAAARLERPVPGMDVLDLGREIRDFADTAAILMHFDLLISVDTSVAHLAAALGRPVWTLLPFAPDWRWLMDREDTPWYPTMRLFRQARAGDWDGVLARVAAALRETVTRPHAANL